MAPTWGRSLQDWQTLLLQLGFQALQAVPQSQGTPFANVLLVAHLQHLQNMQNMQHLQNLQPVQTPTTPTAAAGA